MTPVVNRLSTEFAGMADVMQLNANVRENEALQRSYNLSGHPTFAILDRDGRVIAHFFGVVDESILRETLQQVTQPG